MLTWSQLKSRAMDVTGIRSGATTDITNLSMDLNQGLRLFKNAARRYWTRQEKTTDLMADQNSYVMPPDCVRVTEVVVLNNGTRWPLQQVDSEAYWNKINMVPSMTINLPTFYFIRGFNEIVLFPTPSEDAVDSLVVSYEPRIRDMSIDDFTTGTITATFGSTRITNSASNFTAAMVGRSFQVTDGSDGFWYRVAIFNSSTSIDLETDYQGVSGSSKAYVIAEVPDIPEDYHMGIVYYAAYNFYLKRNDNDTALNYKALYEDLLEQYKTVYGAKTTGVVQSDMDGMRFNLFNIPPGTITG